jgi:hypothetical protein
MYVLMTSPTRQLFVLTQHSQTNPTSPEKKGSRYNPQHAGWSIHGSTTQLLSPNIHWSSNEKQASVDEQATSVYCAYISRMWSIYSILARGDPSVHNRHRRGLLFHITLPTLPNRPPSSLKLTIIKCNPNRNSKICSSGLQQSSGLHTIQPLPNSKTMTSIC